MADAPKPVLLISNVLSALSAALGLPPECFGLELLEDEAAAVEEGGAVPPSPRKGEAAAAGGAPDGVTMRLCVLPLRGVGLKRFGVDGDLLPNKAMAALHELLLDAAPVAPVEEDAVRPLRPTPRSLCALCALCVHSMPALCPICAHCAYSVPTVPTLCLLYVHSVPAL